MGDFFINNFFKLINLGKKYNNIDIFFDLNIVFENSSYAITGVSGSGKSTLLHMLSGIVQPTSGTIFFNDQDLQFNFEFKRNFFLQKSIGLVFQSDCLLEDLTVLENVMIKGLIQNQMYAAAKDEASYYLEYVGLINYANCRPNILSGGQKQRISVARALYGKPSFLLVDEPTSQLDYKNKYLLIDLLLNCQANWNMGLIMTCHDNDIANRMENIFEIVNLSLQKIK